MPRQICPLLSAFSDAQAAEFGIRKNPAAIRLREIRRIHICGLMAQDGSECPKSQPRGRFKSNVDVLRHEWTHVPKHLRPHKCSECGKAFVQESQLQTHVRCHREQKDFGCLCGLEAKDASQIYRHFNNIGSDHMERGHSWSRFNGEDGAMPSPRKSPAKPVQNIQAQIPIAQPPEQSEGGNLAIVTASMARPMQYPAVAGRLAMSAAQSQQMPAQPLTVFGEEVPGYELPQQPVQEFTSMPPQQPVQVTASIPPQQPVQGPSSMPPPQPVQGLDDFVWDVNDSLIFDFTLLSENELHNVQVQEDYGLW